MSEPIPLPALARRRQEPARITERALLPSSGRPEGSEADLTSTVLSTWFILMKRKWVVVGVALGCVAVTLLLTLMATPMYRASTEIQIDREADKIINEKDTRPLYLGDTEQFYETQLALLKSRSLADRVVDSLGLASNPDFLQAHRAGLVGLLHLGRTAPAPMSTDYASRHKRATALVMAHLHIQAVNRSRLVRISVDDANPQTAAKVANAVADGFINENLDRRFQASAYARQFLEQHLADLKQKLEESERQLVAYATQQGIVQIGGGAQEDSDGKAPGPSESLNDASLKIMNDALAKAKTDRLMAEQRWREASGPNYTSLPDVLQNADIQALKARRTQLEAGYQDKLKVFKPDFPSMLQQKAEIDETDKQIAAQVDAIRQSLQQQYEIALHQEQSLEGQVSGLKSSELGLQNRSIKYEILQRDVDTNRSLYDGLLQRYKEIGVAAGVGTNNVSVVDTALPPGGPFFPKPFLNGLLALMFGLVAGSLLAFGLEFIDDSIKLPEDVESKLGIPLLGTIPVAPKGTAILDALSDRRSPVSEAYYSVRTALQFSTDMGAPKSFMIASARPSEGKSTTALALAQNFARLGARVLLIDSDLRKPSLHHYLRCDNTIGFSHYLVGASSLEEICQPTDIPNLQFIPCGAVPPNPAELLASNKVRSLLAEAEAQFDMVVIDGPPVMGLADAPLLASAVAGTVLIIESGTTRRGLAQAALRRLYSGHANVLGAILTKFDVRKAGAGYGYGYGYGPAYAYSYGYGIEGPKS